MMPDFQLDIAKARIADMQAEHERFRLLQQDRKACYNKEGFWSRWFKAKEQPAALEPEIAPKTLFQLSSERRAELIAQEWK